MQRREIRNLDSSLFHLLFCVLHQLSCVACRMPCVSDQKVHVINHIPICANNGKLSGHIFHSGRIIRVVKVLWLLYWPFSGMVRYEERKNNLRMQLLRCDNCLCCQIVKVSVMANDELCHPITLNVSVDHLL